MSSLYLPLQGTSQQLTKLLFNTGVSSVAYEGNQGMSFEEEALPERGKNGFSASWEARRYGG